MSADPTHRHDEFHRGRVPTAQLASGTASSGTVPTSDGVGNVAWTAGGAPTTADYLVGTAQGGLSAEIVVGTTPGGELGGTWASPTVDTVHSGSSHAALPGQLRVISVNTTVQVNGSMVVVGPLVINTGITLTLLDGAAVGVI